MELWRPRHCTACWPSTKTLGEKHEELSQLQTEQEKGTSKDKDAPKRPAGGVYGQFLAQKRVKIKRSLRGGPQDQRQERLIGAAQESW